MRSRWSRVALALAGCVPPLPRMQVTRSPGSPCIGGAVRGVARGLDGQPLAGATVILAGDRAGVHEVTTGEAGVFRFEHLTRGRYTLTALYRRSRSSRRLRVRADRLTQIRITLDERGSRRRGRGR